MHIKVKEQEFEEGAVGYSLDVPIIRSSHLMQEIIHLGFEPNKVINMAYCALKTEYANKPICQYFADNIPENDSEGLRDYFVKKNVAERIEITPHKEFNLFYICLKGGRKG